MPKDEKAEDGPLVFAAVVECSGCSQEFEGVWTDDSIDVEQLVAAPVCEQECPWCQAKDSYEYPGFVNFGDAG